MNQCIKNMRNGVDPAHPHIETTDPVKAYDFVAEHNFENVSVTITGMSAEDMVKYARWTNAKLCDFAEMRISPTGKLESNV
jgi:hypothetical protein